MLLLLLLLDLKFIYYLYFYLLSFISQILFFFIFFLSFFILLYIDIPLDTRHYVLPSGDLLIASVHQSDVRRQYRCRVGHVITGERVDSSNYARVKLITGMMM